MARAMQQVSYAAMLVAVCALLMPCVRACPPMVKNCPIFMPADEWNRAINNDPADFMSDCYVASTLAGSTVGFTGPGISYLVHTSVPWAATSVSFYKHPELCSQSCCCNADLCDESCPAADSRNCCDYSEQSDHVNVKTPSNAMIEGGDSSRPNPSDGARRTITIETERCLLFETAGTMHDAFYSGLTVSQISAFNLTSSNDNRLERFAGRASVLSASASGLPVFPGLLRFEEAYSGTIEHALRFTLPHAQKAFQRPATAFGGSQNVTIPPFGQRFRLKASFDESPYSNDVAALALVRAMKNYGLIFADIGPSMQISVAADGDWSNVNALLQSAPIYGEHFEAAQSPYPTVFGWNVAERTCNGVSSNPSVNVPTPDASEGACSQMIRDQLPGWLYIADYTEQTSGGTTLLAANVLLALLIFTLTLV